MKIRYRLALGFIIVVLLQVVITAVGEWKDGRDVIERPRHKRAQSFFCKIL